MAKSGAIFSTNVSVEAHKEIYRLLGILEEVRECKYLGIPLGVGRERKKAFVYLKEKVWC